MWHLPTLSWIAALTTVRAGLNTHHSEQLSSMIDMVNNNIVNIVLPSPIHQTPSKHHIYTTTTRTTHLAPRRRCILELRSSIVLNHLWTNQFEFGFRILRIRQLHTPSVRFGTQPRTLKLRNKHCNCAMMIFIIERHSTEPDVNRNRANHWCRRIYTSKSRMNRNYRSIRYLLMLSPSHMALLALIHFHRRLDCYPSRSAHSYLSIILQIIARHHPLRFQLPLSYLLCKSAVFKLNRSVHSRQLRLLLWTNRVFAFILINPNNFIVPLHPIARK